MADATLVPCTLCSDRLMERCGSELPAGSSAGKITTSTSTFLTVSTRSLRTETTEFGWRAPGFQIRVAVCAKWLVIALNAWEPMLKCAFPTQDRWPRIHKEIFGSALQTN